MRHSLLGVAMFALSAVALAPQAKADPLPTEIGACSQTTITEKHGKLPTRSTPAARPKR